jgi:hypothetical protein
VSQLGQDLEITSEELGLPITNSEFEIALNKYKLKRT